MFHHLCGGQNLQWTSWQARATNTASVFTAWNYCDQSLLYSWTTRAPQTLLLTTDNPAPSHSNNSPAGNRTPLQHNAQHITVTEINTQWETEGISHHCNSVCFIVCRGACSKLAIYFFGNNGALSKCVCMCTLFTSPWPFSCRKPI